MYTIKCFITAVLIAVTAAEEGHVQGTISDDLEQKPADLLTSLSAEITKSDVEITLSGLKAPEEAATSATEAIDGAKNDKISENITHLKLDQEAASTGTAEHTQKITHTSDDNASFIHVKEKISRQGSDEEFDETDDDEQPTDEKADEFMAHSDTKQTSDELKKAEESSVVPRKNAEIRTVDKKEVEVSENSNSVAEEDIKELLKSDGAEDDIDSATQSRRMLSFDHKLLDAASVPNVEVEPLLGAISGQNNYEHIPLRADDGHHAHHDHHSDLEGRYGKPSGANRVAFSRRNNVPSLPPLSLFHSPGQPLTPHFPSPDHVDNPLSLYKGLPAFPSHLENPHFDETQNHHVNQHFKALQQLFPHHYEPMQPLQSLRPFHFTQTLQHEPQLQHSASLQMFQPLQPSQTFHTLESWEPLQSFQSTHAPRSSFVARSSQSSSAASPKAISSLQPPQMKMDNILSRLQHPVDTDVSNQFSDAFHKSWNFGGFSTFP